MRPNWLVFVVAAAAMAVVALALLGPGAARPETSVRVWGGPWTGVRVLALRLVMMEKMGGIEDLPAGRHLAVSARTVGDRLATAQAETGPDGAADVQLAFEETIGSEVFLSVTDASNRRLAYGRLADAQGRWASDSRSCELSGRQSGGLAIRVAAMQGVFAAPFAGTLVIAVSHEGKPVPGARVYVRAPGTTMDGGTSTEPTDVDGLTQLTVIPLEHEVELAVTAEADRYAAGEWTGTLPVVPGAIWLDPAALETTHPELRIVSPAPSKLVYLTIASENVRLWGGSVPLTPGPAGFAEARRTWPLGPTLQIPSETAQQGHVWVIASTDPYGAGSGTVGWPVLVDGGLRPEKLASSVAREKALESGCQERRPHDLLLLDGQHQAEAREATRRARARLLVIAALTAAALLEALLLWVQFRVGSDGLRRLTALMPRRTDTAAGSAPLANEHGGGLIIALVILVLAFAVIGLVVFWKLDG